MELRTIDPDELRVLAARFRSRAADCIEDYYRSLILRTAQELEEYANSLEANGGTGLVIADEDMVGTGQLN
jgi:hypothetical protein